MTNFDVKMKILTLETKRVTNFDVKTKFLTFKTPILTIFYVKTKFFSSLEEPKFRRFYWYWCLICCYYYTFRLMLNQTNSILTLKWKFWIRTWKIQIGTHFLTLKWKCWLLFSIGAHLLSWAMIFSPFNWKMSQLTPENPKIFT